MEDKTLDRADQHQIVIYVNRIIDLIASNHSSRQICDLMCKEINKSESAVKRYIKRAHELLKEDQSLETDIKRANFLASLERDMNTAYANYVQANKDNKSGTMRGIVWFKQYIEVKDRIAKLQPNQLLAETEAATQKIEINFTEAKKDD